MRVLILLVALLSEHLCKAATVTEEAFQCVKEWKRHPKMISEQELHCARLQHEVDCFSKKRPYTTTVVDEMRFYYDQEAKFNDINNFCNINVEPLKPLVKDLKDKYRHFIVDHDQPSQCAFDIYWNCLRKYNEIIETGSPGSACAALEQFLDCLSSKAQECKADILTHFAQLNESMGRKMLNEMRDTCDHDEK